MRRRAALLLSLLLTAAAPLVRAADDPGILFELDRTRFEVQVRDLRDAREGPALRVVIGSPSHPTPAGSFALHQVVRNPRWTPGQIARGRGAQEKAASSDGPLGVAKISFGPDGVALPLSSGEFRLLTALLERPKIALTRNQLLDLTKGRDADLFDRSIDNHVSRLRKKIEPDPKNPRYIKTVWGGGYIFAMDPEPA